MSEKMVKYLCRSSTEMWWARWRPQEGQSPRLMPVKRAWHQLLQSLFSLRVGNITQGDVGCRRLSAVLPLPVYRCTAVCITRRMHVCMFVYTNVHVTDLLWKCSLWWEDVGSITHVQFYRWTVDRGNYLLKCASELCSIRWPLYRTMYLKL
jgi:hypothetical protein